MATSLPTHCIALLSPVYSPLVGACVERDAGTTGERSRVYRPTLDSVAQRRTERAVEIEVPNLRCEVTSPGSCIAVPGATAVIRMLTGSD
jgi:hypothetical protein